METINQQSTTCTFLVVGAGIAGSLLVWRLHKAGQPVIWIGDISNPGASDVAAGIINPITGRWAVKTWYIDDLIPEAENTYRQLESELGTRIYHPIPIRRFCQNADDVKRIHRRQSNPRYKNVLGKLYLPGNSPADMEDAYGSFDILQAAYVNIPAFLNGLRKRLNLHNEYFQHSELKHENGHWIYRGLKAENVIFCEGAAIKNNPWFKNCPMALVKGETLLVQAPKIRLPHTLYHHRKWILPYPDGSFRIGATHQEHFHSSAPTPSGANELLKSADRFLKKKHFFKILKHLAGIRPGTIDARPIMGSHPTEPSLYIFNGLGAKGASLAPRMSQLLIDHLLQKATLNPEVDIARFQ